MSSSSPKPRPSSRVRKAARERKTADGLTYTESLRAVWGATPSRLLTYLAVDAEGGVYTSPQPADSLTPTATLLSSDGAHHVAVNGRVGSGKTAFVRRMTRGLETLGDEALFVGYFDGMKPGDAERAARIISSLIVTNSLDLYRSGTQSYVEYTKRGEGVATRLAVIVLDHDIFYDENVSREAVHAMHVGRSLSLSIVVVGGNYREGSPIAGAVDTLVTSKIHARRDDYLDRRSLEFIEYDAAGGFHGRLVGVDDAPQYDSAPTWPEEDGEKPERSPSRYLAVDVDGNVFTETFSPEGIPGRIGLFGCNGAQNSLIGGRTGSGKTEMSRRIVAGLAAHGNSRVHVVSVYSGTPPPPCEGVRYVPCEAAEEVVSEMLRERQRALDLIGEIDYVDALDHRRVISVPPAVVVADECKHHTDCLAELFSVLKVMGRLIGISLITVGDRYSSTAPEYGSARDHVTTVVTALPSNSPMSRQAEVMRTTPDGLVTEVVPVKFSPPA